MACALTQGYTFVGCKDQASGIDEWLVTEYANLATLTVTANVVTALTLSAGKQFRQYILDKERGEFSYDLTGSKENSINTYLHKVSFTTNKLTTSITAELDLVAKNYTLQIVKGNDGIYRLFGRVKGMEMTSGTNASAKELGGFHGNVWSFESIQPSFALEVNSALIPTLLTPAIP
jgi:predicted transposase YbfD/YdcC